MPRHVNHTALRLQADTLEMLEREGLACMLNGSWVPMPLAGELVSRLHKVWRLLPMTAESMAEFHYFIRGVIMAARDTSPNKA